MREDRGNTDVEVLPILESPRQQIQQDSYHKYRGDTILDTNQTKDQITQSSLKVNMKSKLMLFAFLMHLSGVQRCVGSGKSYAI